MQKLLLARGMRKDGRFVMDLKKPSKISRSTKAFKNITKRTTGIGTINCYVLMKNSELVNARARENVTGNGKVSEEECYTLSSKLWSANRRLLPFLDM